MLGLEDVLQQCCLASPEEATEQCDRHQVGGGLFLQYNTSLHYMTVLLWHYTPLLTLVLFATYLLLSSSTHGSSPPVVSCNCDCLWLQLPQHCTWYKNTETLYSVTKVALCVHTGWPPTRLLRMRASEHCTFVCTMMHWPRAGPNPRSSRLPDTPLLPPTWNSLGVQSLYPHFDQIIFYHLFEWPWTVWKKFGSQNFINDSQWLFIDATSYPSFHKTLSSLWSFWLVCIVFELLEDMIYPLSNISIPL